MLARHRKTRTIILLGVALVALILLSAGLSGVELLPGRPFTLGRDLPVGTGGGGSLFAAEIFILVFRVFMIIAFLLLPFAIVYLIISPEARKRAYRDLVLLLSVIALYLLMRGRARQFILGQSQAYQSSPPALSLPPSLESVTSPPGWLVWAASLGLSLLIAALVAGVIWLIWRRSRRLASPLEELAQEAQNALDGLYAGADLSDTVMRCYYEMSRVLGKQRGLHRERAMTPREFETYLEKAGLPGENVRQLTRLFEKVRYGAKTPQEDEGRQAVACLTAIVEFCRSPR